MKYSTTSDNGFALGIVPFGAGDYTNDAATFTTGIHNKLTGNATSSLAAAAQTATLNFQGTATRTVATNGNLLTLEQGGIFLNAGFLETQSTVTNGAIPSGRLGTGTITLAGGQFDVRANISNNNTGTYTNGLAVTADSTITVGRFSGANTGGDMAFPTLSIGNQTLVVSSVANQGYALAINGATTLSGDATINNIVSGSSGDSNVRLY